MGIYDREYYREEVRRESVMRHRPWSMIVVIIVVNAVLYLANLFTTGDWLTNELLLHADLFRTNWKVYQLLTAGFVHARAVWHILFNMFALFMLGRPVEQKYGPYEFLAFYLVAILAGNAAWLGWINLMGSGAPGVYGASGGVMAVVLLFCLNWPKEKLLLFGVIPMPAWVLAVFIVGADLLRAFTPYSLFGANVAWQAHLAGAAIGAAYFLASTRLRFSFTRFGKRRFGRSTRWFKPKPNVRVYEPPSEDAYGDLDDEADRVLDKLHRDGETSLTPRERRILEDYARRMRQKHR